MSRKIGFNFWDIKNQKMLYWEDCDRFCSEAACFDNPEEYIPLQHTGLTDTNGIEIVEGGILDIVYTFDPHGDLTRYGVKDRVYVGFCASDVSLCLFQQGEPWGMFNDSINTLKIIGNIYQNKDLLNG